MPFRYFRKALRGTAPVLLALALSSCSVLGLDEDEIRVVNNTGVPIVFLAMELQASYLFDPAPFLTIEQDDPRVLSAGSRRILRMKDIDGPFHLGDDLRFFLYEVTGDTAVSRPIVTLTGKELRDSDYRVSFSGF